MWLILCPESARRIQVSLFLISFFFPVKSRIHIRSYLHEKGLGGIAGVQITLLANVGEILKIGEKTCNS